MFCIVTFLYIVYVSQYIQITKSSNKYSLTRLCLISWWPDFVVIYCFRCFLK